MREGAGRSVGVFFTRRVGCLLVLGFASGLPYALTTDTLQAWLAAAHVDVARIGLFGLVALPYTLKFLWSPLMDRYVPPLLGRRRGWLLVTQVLVAGAMLAMAGADPRSPGVLAGAALCLAFFSASQDVVGDAYRTDVLEPAERGAGAAVWVTGYRLALLASGAGALLLVAKGWASFPGAIVAVAGLFVVGPVATLMAPEPERHPPPPPTLGAAVVRPLADLLGRRGGVLVLLFVVLFTLPEVLAKGMSLPFMLDIGVPLGDIARVRQVLGIAMTIAGTLVGGAVTARVGLWRSLWLFAVLGAVSNLGFYVLATTSAEWRMTVLVGALSVESFCAGLVTAGFLAFLMSQCNPRYSATQFALLSSLMRLTDVLSRPVAGYVAGRAGWPAFFALTVPAAAPALVVLAFLPRDPVEWGEGPEGGPDFPVVGPVSVNEASAGDEVR